MPVLVTAESKLTREMYEGMLSALGDLLRSSPGFIAHMAGPTADGWCVNEIWQSQREADEFYAKKVFPHLPEGIRPKRSVRELHTLLR